MVTASATRVVEVEKRVNGSPGEAFVYFTDPALHVQWQGIEAEIDPVPGGEYVVHITPAIRVRGRFVEIEFPNRLVLAWGFEADPGTPVPSFAAPVPPESTRVEISFVAEGSGTIVRIVHSGLPSDAAANFTGMGWEGYLERLVRRCAGADPGPDPFARLL